MQNGRAARTKITQAAMNLKVSTAKGRMRWRRFSPTSRFRRFGRLKSIQNALKSGVHGEPTSKVSSRVCREPRSCPAAAGSMAQRGQISNVLCGISSDASEERQRLVPRLRICVNLRPRYASGSIRAEDLEGIAPSIPRRMPGSRRKRRRLVGAIRCGRIGRDGIERPIPSNYSHAP